jgi:hypothetical protein
MTTLREAAEMALEALIWPLLSSTWEAKNTAAVNALQTALEQPDHAEQSLGMAATCKDFLQVEQEPVAYGYRDARGNIRLLNHYETKMDRIPLYTSPPQRQPLTDEEIAAILSQSAGVDLKLNGGDLLFARAIERAHGIGSQE